MVKSNNCCFYFVKDDEEKVEDKDEAVVSQAMGEVLYPADLTVSKRPGTSFRIEIHFAVFNRLYLLFSFIKLVKTW